MSEIPFTDQPQPFAIKAVEEKKKLDSGARIAKVGLEAQDGTKFWAEMFVPKDGNWPQEGNENLIIQRPDNPEWAPKAVRPGGKRKGGGGGARFDPVEDAARQAMIIAQSARTAALEELRLAGRGQPESLDGIRKACDERVKQITEQALELGEKERAKARGRK